MDIQLLIQIAQVLIVAILIMVSVNLYLVLKLKEIDPFAQWNPTAINGGLFMAFGIFGTVAAIMGISAWNDKMIFLHEAASAHGREIDGMMMNTMYVSIAVVVITCGLLFFYSWKYRYKPGRKALYYPKNDKLELVWTIVPAVVLTLLVADGVMTWHGIFRDVPEEAIEIEMMGRQFDWTIRYPGGDEKFGESSIQYINDAQNNIMGLNWEDQAGHDDIVTNEIHLPVGVPVNFKIRSRDVLHSATMPHFRMKMDAVPGMPTSFWLTPEVTTAEMRERTGNPEFNFEMSCQQICGGGHWNMRRVIVVETMEEYQRWLGGQQPLYSFWQENYGGGEDPVKDLAEEETSTEEQPITMN